MGGSGRIARRDVFGAAAAAVAVVCVVPLAARADSGDWLVSEVAALIDLENRLNLGNAPDEEWERWDERRDHLLNSIERMPCTAEYMKAKALGFFLIHRGDLGDFLGEDPSTDQRLAAQIIQCAMGAH